MDPLDKYRDDLPMSLSEHATTSGYGLSSLKEMKLPLIHGKIAPSDLRRVFRRRQDAIEAERGFVIVIENCNGPGKSALGRMTIKGSGESIAAPHSKPLSVGKFRAPR